MYVYMSALEDRLAEFKGLTNKYINKCLFLSDIKDSLMQALASYVCYPQSLRAVERIPEEQ